MKLKVLVLLLCLPILALARDKQERYSDSTAGFSFAIPPSWQTTDALNEKYKIVFGPRVNDFTPNISTEDDVFAGTIKDYATQGQAKLEAMSKELGYDEVKPLRRAEFATDTKIVGEKLTNFIKAKGREFIFSSYTFDGKGNTKFIFTCASLAADVQKVEPLCDASMKTLTIVK
ncbi:MAG: hypothetical protein M3268_03340 [Acidobacteriota bacterium]|nr:hypothetical protein [Acidobacteriota bacterium]